MLSRESVASLVHTGLAPDSFYTARADGIRPHYNGLPVDFIAPSMVAIGAQADGEGCNTYHIENPHDDNISLDLIVEKLRQLATDSSGDIPQLSRAFVLKCLRDMIVLNMIGKEQSANAV